MCGICGKIYHDQDRKAEQSLIEKMSSLLTHRGPDDSGVYVKGSIGLGHRRLSIIDLSPAGRQPMCNEDGTVWIVFNGEIYNFLELRDELEKKGHVFSSRTDTETIIHLYEEKGVECLSDLRGMFAFALWDERKKRLFLARDRLGKKPLVYSLDNEGLLFASEIKSVLVDPGVKKEIDNVALHHYLTYQYVPSPLTIFKGIRKLPPAHYMVYENGKILIRRYWNLSYQKKLKCGSLTEYKEHFLDVFKEAVRIRLKSDVPFGAFLSGGVDSSITVALMSNLLEHPVKTFSIGFEEEEYNELPYAKMVARQYHTDHHEFIVKPDVIEILPKLIWYYNEPFSDSSAIPTYCLSKMTKDHVTVALNGDGSDECFAGYERYAHANLSFYLQKIVGFAGKNIIKKAVDSLPDGPHRNSFLRRLKRYSKVAYENPERQYVRSLCHFDNDMKDEIYSQPFKEQLKDIDSVDLTEDLYNSADGKAFLDKTLYVDVMAYLPEDLLVKVDIASMANSLEARSPFVDHKVMEFAASLPPDLKLRGFETKYLLKHVLDEFLPAEILSRKKMGFAVPMDRWLRKDLKEMVYSVLLDKTSSERGYFRKEAIQGLVDEHVSGRRNHSFRLWNLLCLELWHRMFMDRSPGISG